MAMKRAWRWALVGAGVVVLLLAVIAAVACSSAFQTAVGRSFLRTMDPQAQLQEVSLGLSGGDVRGLKVSSASGASVSFDDAALKYSVGSLFFGKVMVIDRLTLTGLVVNATTASTSSPSGTTTAQSGVTASTKASGGLTPVLIKQVDLSGTFLLPGRRTVSAKFTGHDFGAGGAGLGQGQWVFQDEGKDAAVREIRVDTQMNVPFDALMGLQAANLTVQLAATLPGQAQPSQLTAQVTATATRSDGARDFSLGVTQPGAGGNTTAQLLTLTGTCQGSGVIAGNFSVNCTSGQVAAFALGAKLPEFDAQGSADFSTDANGGGSVKAKVSAKAGQWEKMDAALTGLGNLQLDGGLDASWTNNTMEARSMNLALGPAGAQPVVTLDLVKPVTVDYSEKTLHLTQGSGTELVRLNLQEIPVKWLSYAANFFGSHKANGSGEGSPSRYGLTDSYLNGQAVLGSQDDGTITAETTQPWMLERFNLTDNGTVALSEVSLTLNAAASYKDGNVQANLRQLILSSGTTPLAQLAANVSFGTSGNATPLKADGRLAMAIDQIAQQPFAKDWAASLPGGEIKVDGTFDLTKTANTLDLNALEAMVAQGSTPWFTVKLAQKISLPVAEGATMPAMVGDLATVEADGFPLELLGPFLPKGMVLTGDPLLGRVMIAGASNGQGGLVLRTDQPLTVNRLNFSKGGKLMLSDVAVTLDPEGAWSADGKTMNGTVQLQASAPAGTLFNGTVQAGVTDGNLALNFMATGGLNALAAQPVGSSWSGALPGAPQNYALSANITKINGNLTVETAEARVAPPDNPGTAMAEVKLLQPVTLPEAPANTTAATPWPALTGDLASVQLAGLPVGVVGLTLPTGYDVRGQTVTADLKVRGEGAGVYSVAANLPLTVERLSVLHNFDPLIDELTVTGRPVAKFNQDGLTSLAVYDLMLTSAGKDIGNGHIEYSFKPDGKTLAAMKISVSADVAELLQQPMLHAYDNLSSGQGTLDGNLTPDGNFTLSADFTQWQVREPARTVKEMALVGATGRLGPASGAMQLTAPLHGTGANGDTNCTLNLTLTPAANGRTFSLNLAGDGLVPNDVMAIVNGFTAPNGGEPQRPTGMAAPEDTAPATESLWGNMTGVAQVNLKRLGLDALDLGNVTGAAQVTPAQVTVGNLTAQLAGGAPLNFNGTLAFDPAQAAQPYNLQAKLSLRDFDSGVYFKKRDPQAQAPVDGKFSINGTTDGRGANMSDLLARVPFDFTLSSNTGTIYLLSLVNKRSSAALAILRMGSGLLSGISNLLGNKGDKPKQFSDALDQMMTLFNQIEYTNMAFEAQRGADRNINLTQINVLSPEISLNGSGRISYRAGVPIPAQPLSVKVQIGARGNTAIMFSRLGLMTPPPANSTTYVPGPQFQVGGTLQQPDYVNLLEVLAQAAMKGSGLL